MKFGRDWKTCLHQFGALWGNIKIHCGFWQKLTVFKAPKDQLLKPVLDKFEVAWVSHLETVAQSEAQRLKRDISSVPTRWCRHYFKILQLKCVQGQSFITSEKFGPGLELRPWPKLLNSIILSEYLSHCLWTEMLHNFLKCNFPGLWPQRFIFILKIILT